jgi:hypothetical protein
MGIERGVVQAMPASFKGRMMVGKIMFSEAFKSESFALHHSSGLSLPYLWC